MRVALRELRRRPGRFAAATAILALIASLLLLLGGLLDGLIDGATSAVAAQPGDVIVFSDTAEASFLRSRISPELRQVVEDVPGVDAVGGVGVAQLGARVPGNDARDLADVALFGYELAPSGVPSPPPAGTAYADRSLESAGVEDGTVLLLGPSRTPIEVVGWVEGLAYSGQGSLYSDAATWRAVLNQNRPDAGLGEGVFQSLVVQASADADPSELVERIDASTGGPTESLTLDEAVEAIPGVEQQRATFNQIIGVTALVAMVVVALFFALLTVERTALYGVLKALGAGSATLFAGVVAQAVVVTGVAASVGVAAAVALDRLVPPGGIPFLLLPARALSSVALLLAAAVIGCSFSLRRVLRIDPASAIGSST